MRCCDPGRGHTLVEFAMQSVPPAVTREPVITSQNVVPLAVVVSLAGLAAYSIKKTGAPKR